MSLTTSIFAPLQAAAEAEWAKIKAEGIAIEQAVVPVLETGLAQAVQQFGSLAVQTAMSLMTGEFQALTGEEKQGKVVTTVVQAAEVATKALTVSDAQALAKSAYVAAMGAAAKG